MGHFEMVAARNWEASYTRRLSQRGLRGCGGKEKVEYCPLASPEVGSSLAAVPWAHIRLLRQYRMPGPILYSANPWFATDVASKYRRGIHFAWVCECFDITTAPVGSAAAMIAPTSSPCRIYRNLSEEYKAQDEHSSEIQRYKKTFSRLAKKWFVDGSITQDQRDEIIASVRATSWRIWKPVLYIIPRAPIEAASRLISVPRPARAGYGPEQQILDLRQDEFDIIEVNLC